jgi:DNA primase
MSLRYSELPHKGGRVYPALVACISSPEGPLQGIQRTYLAADGLGKADVPDAKLSLGKVTGGAIRLGSLNPEMIVCAGVEDGLSLFQELNRSIWAVPGDGNLGSVLLPSSVQSVAIGGDNDGPGRAAAEKAVWAHAERGLKAHAFFPDGVKDFNELIQMEAAR